MNFYRYARTAHVKENSVDSERECFCRDYYEWALLFTGYSPEGMTTNMKYLSLKNFVLIFLGQVKSEIEQSSIKLRVSKEVQMS